ncbi:cyclic GMP-AMP synthase DncV-like nucleotidyltransferase [Vibrio sp. 1F279]|uniref:cyclic GMP-AMP synthase DncV-like nucleotidyltransferase n=1 Tax=unclassified Vibrio TaxID=2614977 RepID=UPI00352FE674
MQETFLDYHDQIKLGTYDEDESLRDKRNLLTDTLTELLKDEKVPDSDKKLTFKTLDQGSYAMRTGVKPLNGDYDIDVGIVFDITIDEYDSKKLKNLVYDKLNKQHNRTVDYNRPCITVPYATGYHVDFPIYAKKGDDLYIAWGKKNSEEHEWYESDPEGLKTWVKSVSEDAEERRQFRRCVKYLKRWKNKNFCSSGNAAPPSIGLTIQARRSFNFKKDSDLSCLIGITKSIRNKFIKSYCSDDKKDYYTVKITLPVKPKKNIYYKMTKKQLDNFYHKVDELVEALEAAKAEESLSESSKILKKVFGDFPLLNDAVKSEKKPYVPTGMSA